jgi:glucose/arabinose dehydrogenase
VAVLAVCTLGIASCGGQTPPAPPSAAPPSDNTITGNERIGWDQSATDATELASYHYAIYVDGTRSELTGASCASSSTNGAFACNARLPSMSRGTHTLELATFVVDSGVVESAKSAALTVNVTGISAALAPSSARGSAADGDAVPVRAGDVVVAGETLALDAVADGPSRPTDLVMTADGRLLISDRSGAVRVVQDGRLLDQPALTMNSDRGEGSILSLDLDPEFERTRYVFALSTARGAGGDVTYVVARYREAGNTLGDRVVLLDGVRATPENASGALRFGPDRKLYVVFNDGGDPSQAEDPASYNGKVLRLNADATTPDDQRAYSPVFASGLRSPEGMGWTSAGVLWLIQGGNSDPLGVTAILKSEGPRTIGIAASATVVAEAADPSALAVYRDGPITVLHDNLLVADGTAHRLLRMRIDEKMPTRVAGTEALLADRIGPLRAVRVGPDGAVYLAIDGAIARLKLHD